MTDFSPRLTCRVCLSDHLEVVDTVHEELAEDGVLSLSGHLDILDRIKTGAVDTASHMVRVTYCSEV